ncbi:minor tail protein [Arthrobacter phage Cassia]|uniref:Minor tail protein n=1 Tax=Arthrobacter phage Cassia TaxID=2927275 RepID=A0AAF0GM42_9CAUD|nr:minor tail protein [Arthrobacter phage Cassia]
MADAAAKLAAELADLKRRVIAMERGQQFAHSTIDVDGEAVPVPDVITETKTTAEGAVELSNEALSASTELDTRLSTAEGDLTASKERLDTAEAELTETFGRLDAVETVASDAATAASNAQTAADNAHDAADAADARAAEAMKAAVNVVRDPSFEGTAWADGTTWISDSSTARTGAKSLRVDAVTGTKTLTVASRIPVLQGQTWRFRAYSKTTPDYNGTTSWGKLRLGSGAGNSFISGPKWNVSADWTVTEIEYTVPAGISDLTLQIGVDHTAGQIWFDDVEATDITALKQALAAAQAAHDAADAADAKAVAAQTAAGNAQDTADNALTMAGSKGKVYYSTSAPSGTATATGDLWRKIDASKNVIGEWYWTGSAWQSSQITTDAISNLDVGKLTAGSAAILTVTAQKIAASTASFQTVDVKNLFATSGTLDTAVIDKLWTDVVNSRKITTGMLLVGRGTNLINWIPGDVTLFKSQSGGGGTTYYATSDTDAGGACVRSDAPNVTAGTFSYVTQISSGTTAANGIADAYDIEPGASYRLQMRATYGGTTQPGATTQPTVRFMVRFFDGAKASLGDVQYTAGAGKASYSGTLVTWEGQAPANAVAAHIYIQQDQPTGSTGQLYLSLFGFYKKTSSVLIENGAVTAEKLESTLVLASEVIAGNPAGNHAKLDQNGFRVMAPPSDGAAPAEVIRLGTETDDYFGVVGADGNLTASITAAGGVSAKEVNVADVLTLKGEDLGSKIDYMPQRLVAWGQVPIDTSTMLINGAGEIGLFELGWDSNQEVGRDSRMYLFNVNNLLIRSTVTGQVGLRLRYTTDGSKPTVNSPVIQYSYGYVGVASGYTSFNINRIIGSNNGEYLRVLVTLWNGATGTASVLSDSNQTHIYSTVVDLGGTLSPTAIASTGGGTTGTKAPVTTTKEYKANAIKSYTGTGAWYNYNTGYMYSGLSPANYGDLRSVATFPSFTSDLSGATVNDVWIYVYYDFWYYGSGGNAAISLHGYSTPPGSSPSLSFSMMSNGWPRAAGRWVRLPDSTYAGFKSGTYKGFGLGGHGGGYTEYGYAHDARIKIRYTK